MNIPAALTFAVALGAITTAVTGAQSPAPEASTPAPAAKLEDSIKALGIGLQLPQGWHVTGGNLEAGIKALIIAPEGRDGELVILRSEPAKERTLQVFSSSADFPQGGRAVRICNGTQDGWYADYADDRGASDAERYAGFAVIAVDARNAIAAAYSHRRSMPETAEVRKALMNLCLR
jgi:hypothetical protein